MSAGPPLLRIFEDAEALSLGAADEFLQVAGEAIAESGRFAVALSGGSTPRRLFQHLAAAPRSERLDWPRVHLFWGDERSVPPDHADSNYRMTREALLDHVPIPPGNVHRLEAERPDRDAAAREYESKLAEICAAPGGAPPALDLVLLGMGPDGHTASLFPHTQALAEKERWVVVNYVPKFETDRVTFTVPMLNAAKRVRFLAAGADKADMLWRVLEGPREPEELPSQLIQPVATRTVWMVDRGAAARLTKTEIIAS